LKPVKDRVGATFQVGVSVGKDARSVKSGAEVFKGKIEDIRPSEEVNDFEKAVEKQFKEPEPAPPKPVEKKPEPKPEPKKVVIPNVTPAPNAADDPNASADAEAKALKESEGATPEEDAKDEEELNNTITEVETIRTTAAAATEESDKLVKEELEAKQEEKVVAGEATKAEEDDQKADEEEVEAELEEETENVKIEETKEKAEKTTDPLEQADHQEKLDAAIARAKELAEKKRKAKERKVAMMKRWAEIRAKMEAAKKKAIMIRLAKAKAERARKKAEALLKAKTARLQAQIRRQKLKEKIAAARKKDMGKTAKELDAKTAANCEEAEQIWETAKDVLEKVKVFQADLDANKAGKDKGYKAESIGCFKDRWKRDLPTTWNNKRATTHDVCMAYAKAKGFKYIGMQYGGECWMGHKFGRYGQKPDTDCKMKCRIEKDKICGAGWRNSIFAVNSYDPKVRLAKMAKETTDSINGIIKDINDARGNAFVARRMANKLALLTAYDMRVINNEKRIKAANTMK